MKRDVSEETVKSLVYQCALQDVFTQDTLPVLEVRYYKTGEYLCRAGSPMETFDIITEGQGKVESTSEEGKVILLDHLYPLSLSGDIELICGGDAMHSVYAATPLTTLTASRKNFKTVLMNSTPFLQFLTVQFAEKMQASSQNHSRIMLYPIRNQLGHILLTLSDTAGADVFVLRSGEVAKELGISGRHLRRVLQEYEREGILLRQGSNLHILDKKALSEKAAFQ